MNKYVTIHRLKDKVMCGDVNIPAQRECFEKSNIIICDNKPICYATSYNGHKYFAINNDGKGFIRGKLRDEIDELLFYASQKEHLSDAEIKKKEKAFERRAAISENSKYSKYRKPGHTDVWLWNHDYYVATTIEELEEIKQYLLSI